MAWVITGLFALLAFFFWSVNRKLAADSVRINSFMVLVLLDDEVRGHHRQELIRLSQTTSASNAQDLGVKINLALDQLAARIPGPIIAGAPRILWKIKQGEKWDE